jgi:hypothetical protein
MNLNVILISNMCISDLNKQTASKLWYEKLQITHTANVSVLFELQFIHFFVMLGSRNGYIYTQHSVIKQINGLIYLIVISRLVVKINIM